jgi:hypothetical protein
MAFDFCRSFLIFPAQNLEMLFSVMIYTVFDFTVEDLRRMPAMEIASKNFQFADVNARDSIMRATFIYNFVYRRQIQFDSIGFNMMDPKIIVMMGPKIIVMFWTCTPKQSFGTPKQSDE